MRTCVCIMLSIYVGYVCSYEFAYSYVYVCMFLFHMYAALTVVSGELLLSTSLGTSFRRGDECALDATKYLRRLSASLVIGGFCFVADMACIPTVFVVLSCVVTHGRVFSANQRMYFLDV